MAKRRGISISLAAKCQLLFGLAVLVIIAGALAVPWQRMEQLANVPNIKAARFAADLLFRQVHAGQMNHANSPPATAALNAPRSSATRAAAGATAPIVTSGGGGGGVATRPAWEEASLIDTDYPQPRMFIAESPTGKLKSLAGGPDDLIAIRAMRRFREFPQESEHWEMETVRGSPASAGTTTSGGGEGTRLYRYVAAIRLDASCLKCHSNYNAWMPTESVLTTTRAAGTQTAAATQALEGRAGALGGRTGMGGAAGVGGLGAPAAAGTPIWPVVGVVRVDVPYQTDENELLLNRIVIVVAGMLGGALAIVVFYLITSRLILQPVRVLKNTAEKVAMGDLNIRSAISTGDEFQHLSETFNDMLSTLQASQDQLEATNRSLDTRVGELSQSNVDLYEANRVKSEFLTNVTHELRTPLNAIIGFADLMADTAKDPKQQRYSENIRTSARQLLELINDLLDLAKIEAGKLVLREEKVSVADVCEAMANFMRPLAQKKGISLDMAVEPDLPLIVTDPGRFQQILYNFLSNAIKFTPQNGHVAITAGRYAAGLNGAGAVNGAAGPAEFSAIRVAITDSGPGISPEDQKIIFEKFRQLDGSVTRVHSGSGLGLAISRELANMLGARIEVISAVGKGATFSLIIPAHNPHVAAEGQPAARG